MKTEQEARNSKDMTDEKMLYVLECFLMPDDAQEMFEAIKDNQLEIDDIELMLNKYDKGDGSY